MRQAVVATQWEVSDEAAAIVAGEFYDRYLAGASAAEALREAKLALLDHRAGARGATIVGRNLEPATARRFSHPSSWAPFVVFGK